SRNWSSPCPRCRSWGRGPRPRARSGLPVLQGEGWCDEVDVLFSWEILLRGNRRPQAFGPDRPILRGERIALTDHSWSEGDGVAGRGSRVAREARVLGDGDGAVRGNEDGAAKRLTAIDGDGRVVVERTVLDRGGAACDIEGAPFCQDAKQGRGLVACERAVGQRQVATRLVDGTAKRIPHAEQDYG